MIGLRCCAQFIAGMLGSMGVQGAVQVMHTTIPMEWTPNMGELAQQMQHVPDMQTTLA